MFSFRQVKREVREDFRIEAKRPVDIPIVSCRLAGMWLAAINEEDLSSRCCMQTASIGVLLDAFFDEADDEVLVRMTREPVRYVACMNNFYLIRSVQAIKPNPLRRLRHG